MDIDLVIFTYLHRVAYVCFYIRPYIAMFELIYLFLLRNLTYKRHYVCLFVCMRAMAGRTAGPIKTKLGIGTDVDPGSVLVKVKVKVMRYNRIHDRIQDRKFTSAPSGEQQ